jgi:serine/threonine protein kinase
VNATVLLTAVDIDIPGYRIVRPIGEGGMASVFLAVQKSLDREVALKIMSPVLASNAEFASRFLTEGKITAKLQHPNLVTVHDIGSHKGVYYLAAEYVPGGTLKERIADGGLSVAEILDIASDIAHGLDFAHEKGFVHRDVKPGNVLFRNDGRVVLADFGIAKAMDGSNSSTVAGASIGTPDYMSPEQARGEPVDGRSDLYSLGTVLYEMLIGHPPYQASDPFTVALMHVTHPTPQLPAEHSWLQPLLDGLMAKLPQERYNTGAALVEAIHKLLANAPQVASLQQATPRKAGGKRIAGSAATQQRTRLSLSKASERPAWLGPSVIGGGLLIAVLSTWAWFGRDSAMPASDDVAASMAETQTSLSTSIPGNVKLPQPIDSPMQQVETFLAQADAYLARGTDPKSPDLNRMVIFPEDESALAYYRRALEIDPSNVRARQGIDKIVDFYKGYAYKLCDLGQWGNCMTIAKNGLVADPTDAYLLEMSSLAEQARNGASVRMPPPRIPAATRGAVKPP